MKDDFLGIAGQFLNRIEMVCFSGQ